MILCSGRCVCVWIYRLVRGGFRAEDLNCGRIIMGVRSIGRANIIPARSQPQNSTLVRAYLSCFFFTLLFVPPSVFSQKIFAQSKMKACECSSWFESNLQPFLYFLPCYIPQYHRVQSKLHTMELWEMHHFSFYCATSLLFSWCTASDLIVSPHYAVSL